MPLDRIVIDSGYLLESVLPTKREWQSAADHLIERLISRDLMGVVPIASRDRGMLTGARGAKIPIYTR